LDIKQLLDYNICRKNIKYYLFIDESGESCLNYLGSKFVLATVIIKQEDFIIIEGYLRLLKKRFLGDDFKLIHTTDLFERPYQNYRKLVKPRSRISYFINELNSILLNIPYKTGIYFVDKNKLRTKLSYVPRKKNKNPSVNIDLSYELCSLEAIKDFAKFLVSEKASGEIVIESRQHQDGTFVKYFDLSKKNPLPGNIVNPLAVEVRERIHTLTISTKKVVNGGLEIADICSYVTYRSLIGDPGNRLKIQEYHLKTLFATIKKNSYLVIPSGRKIKEVT
jgi:hypothetical protein